MKNMLELRNIIIIFAASSLLACTQETINEISPRVIAEEEKNMKERPGYRTYEEALVIAQNAIGILEEDCNTRSNKPRVINTTDVQYIVNTSSTRSSEEKDTLMYVFNYEDNAGFAIVSARTATEGLIAVTEQGNYIVGEETENMGFNIYMDMAKAYISNANERAVLSPDTLSELIRHEYDRVLCSYGPYLNVRWGQESPYNQYCISDEGEVISAGCLTTALAQVISYYDYPTQLTINYDGNSSLLVLNWDQIKNHYSSVSCTCSEHETIGKMFRQLGYELGIDYGAGRTGNGGDFIEDAFDILGYTYGNRQNYSREVVEGSLSEGKLLYIKGYLSRTEAGHAWVIDGFKKIQTTTIEYIKNSVTGLYTEIWRGTNNRYYNHFNWGWNGNSNGFYLCNVFNVQNYTQLDAGVTSTITYNFTYDIEILPYITH